MANMLELILYTMNEANSKKIVIEDMGSRKTIAINNSDRSLKIVEKNEATGIEAAVFDAPKGYAIQVLSEFFSHASNAVFINGIEKEKILA